MAGGTLARLVVAVGIDDTQMTSGIAKTRANLLSNLTSMGSQAETSVAKTAAGITRSSGSFMSAIRGPVAAVLTGVIAVGAGLGFLAMKFESETAHIAASAGITNQAAEVIGNAFLAQATKGQSLIYTAQDITSSYATVAGQMTLVQGKALNATQALGLMTAAENLAAGSNSSLSDSTSAIASVIQNFNLKVSDATNVSNVLFDASKGLNTSVGATADMFEKIEGRIGPAAGGLQSISALIEDMTNHSIAGQRNINAFAGAINALLGASANPAKVAAASDALKTAQLNLTAAQLKLNQAETTGGASSAAHVLALNRLQVAEDKLAIARATYPSMAKQVVEAELAVESAQVRATSATTSNADKVALATIAVQKAKDAVDKAQLAATGLGGNAAALLQTLHVNAFGVNNQFIGMNNLIAELHTAFATMNPEQQRNAATILFTSQSASMMLGVINSGPAAYQKYLANVNASNSAHVAAERAIHSLQGAWQVLVAQIQGSATTLSVAIAPFLTGLLKGVSADLPTVLGILKTGFGDIGNVAKAVWPPISAVIGFLSHNLWLVEAVLAVIIGKFVITKALDIAKMFADWTIPLAKLVTPGGQLSVLQKMFGLGEKGSITQGFMDAKNAWNDTFSVAQQVKAQNLGKSVEDATTKVQGMVTQLETLGNIKLVAPSENVDTMINSVKAQLVGAQPELARAASEFAKDPIIGEALTGNLVKGITNPRVAQAAGGIMANAADALKNSGVYTEAGTAIGDAIAVGAKDAKVGSTIAADFSTSISKGGILSDIVGSATGSGSGVLTKAFGLAGKAATLLAQPVFLMGASPAYFAELKLASAVGNVPTDIVSEAEKLLGSGGAGVAGAAVTKVGVGSAADAVTALLPEASVGIATIAATVIGAAVVGAAAAVLIHKLFPQWKTPGTDNTPPTGATRSNPLQGIASDLSLTQLQNPNRPLDIRIQPYIDDITKSLIGFGIKTKNAAADAAIVVQAYEKGDTPAQINQIIINLRNQQNSTLSTATAASMISGQFSLLQDAGKTHGIAQLQLLGAVNSSIQQTSTHASNTSQETQDIFAAMQSGKITTVAQLQNFEKLWDDIPAGTKNIQGAQAVLYQGIMSGTITNAAQVKQLLVNWNTFTTGFGDALPPAHQITQYINSAVTPASGIGPALQLVIDASGYITKNLYANALALQQKVGTYLGTTTTGYHVGLAAGGDVVPNRAYWVGEAGKELFVSKEAGTIVPKSQAGAYNKIPPYNVPGFEPMGAAQGVRQAPVIGVVNVYNPTAEPASSSVEERLRQISYLGQV